jgi:hypothetical protein
VGLAAVNRGAGLGAEDFRLTCESGFGDGWNAYAHSMAWFEGRLYVGTTRAPMAAIKVHSPAPDMKPWPVDCPPVPDMVDRRAEIWCYEPEADRWERVFKAAYVPSRRGGQTARFLSFRGMTVFQAPGDDKPCLYVSTWSPALTFESPDILRSEDGRTFEPVTRPPWDASVRTFRTLQVYQGRVHTSPTGSNRGGVIDNSVGSETTIYACDDLRSGRWEPVCEEGFGDRRNVTVFEMCEFAGRLYAGTVNPFTGFELWRTEDPPHAPPYRWKRVLSGGAGRGPLNEIAGSLTVFNGALYVGTGIANGGYHRAFRLGPAPAELLRVWPDDSWELVMGQPRRTPQGLRNPLSGYSGGFDNFLNGYIWRMTVHDGWLYAGTFSWAMLLPYIRSNAAPVDVLAMFERWGQETLVRRYGGCELWRSPDGIRWQAVTRSGFGNKYNWGVRTLQSTPHGLFVGTANPFGPTIALREGMDWSYIPNARGGCEVWLGAAAASAAA